MRKIYLVVAVIAVFLCIGCNDGGVESGGGDAVAYLTKFRSSAGAPPLNDERDGNVYRTVIIGNQTWMAENLNYNTADGNGSWCYGQDGLVSGFDGGLTLSEKEVQGRCKKFGRLYDWETANSVCPAKWKLPSEDDWTQLMSTVGGSQDIVSKKLRSSSGWEHILGANGSGNGTDDFGFSALPGGVWWGQSEYDGEELYYSDEGVLGVWWTTATGNYDNSLNLYGGYFAIFTDNRAWLSVVTLVDYSARHSVRCVKEEI